ncbi:MAG: hypothetical protein KKB03_03350 [Nanoarchaeota archaeon]|nr:hypothetical protein [Nanoarchaeota archaeon]MBU1134909.1 hypothetical protein [Nanoarchaeota archaeon]MBU2520252.1 hypothetical protein [Nanoarchaeota archaeon]
MEAAKKMINRKLIFGIIFLVFGFFLLQYVFTGECEFQAPSAGALGENLEISLGSIEKWICNATSFPNIFLWLVGLACIFPGVGGIFKGLTKD